MDPLLLGLFAIVVLAGIVSIELALSIAIVEIVAGMLVENAWSVDTASHAWLPFLAGIGSVTLTFLAGAETDAEAMRKTWKASLSIGGLSFLAPFLGAWSFSYLVLGWTWNAALIAGVALSTTSVAVVYVVLVESGLTRTDSGKLILSACFITDLGTALALSFLFVQPNAYILVMGAVWRSPSWP